MTISIFGLVASQTSAGIEFFYNATTESVSGNSFQIGATGIVTSDKDWTALVTRGPGGSIANQGQILGGAGILCEQWTDSTIHNDGVITGERYYGIQINTSDTASITNTGHISGGDQAILIIDSNVTLQNTGLITSTSLLVAAVDADHGDTSLVLDNGGTISGPVGSITGSIGMDQIRNFGILVGDVDLRGNADYFNGFGGTVHGDVALGAGADTFRGLNAVIDGEVIGGTGNDTYYTDDATLILTEEATPGDIDQVFAATSFQLASNIENLTLLGTADFRGIGNASANGMHGNAGDNRLTGQLGNDSILGADGDDRLLGNLGNDTLRGDAGADRIIGGLGKDYLVGGTEEDSFVFTALAQSGAVQTTADVIADFIAGEDVIDLSAIDAYRSNTTPNDSFAFIGTAAFTGSKGEVRYVLTGGVTYIEINTNTSVGPDCMIKLSTAVALNAADFVL